MFNKGNNLIGKILISKISFKGSNPFFPETLKSFFLNLLNKKK
jgi:hypothetical protein